MHVMSPRAKLAQAMRPAFNPACNRYLMPFLGVSSISSECADKGLKILSILEFFRCLHSSHFLASEIAYLLISASITYSIFQAKGTMPQVKIGD
jgi:hypothetical protein